MSRRDDEYINQWHKYRWEFLRRNQEYVSDWMRYKNFEESNRQDEAFDLLKELLRKWGLMNAYPLSFSFDIPYESIERQPHSWLPVSWTKEVKDKMKKALISDYKSILSDECLVDFNPIIIAKDSETSNEGIHTTYRIAGYERKNIRRLTDDKVPRSITMKIDNFPSFLTADKQTRADITKSITGLIMEQLSIWSTYMDEKGDTGPSSRMKVDKYDEYLRVWDLFREGKTAREVAQLIWPDEYQPNEDKIKRAKSGIDQKAIEEYDSFVSDAMKHGATREEAEKQAEAHYTNEVNESAQDINPLIDKAYKYRDAAEKLINNKQLWAKNFGLLRTKFVI